MIEEDAFIRAMLAAPGDATPRLIYADWLEERGDPRNEYLRLVFASGAFQVRSAANEASERLKQLQERMDPLWLAVVHHGFRAEQTDPGGDSQGERRARRRRRRTPQEADIGLFLKQYGRKTKNTPDPNDRHYSREIEARVKRMKPEELDRLMRGEEDDA
jgi:uncharacterized protein (TIGR02996 family)